MTKKQQNHYLDYWKGIACIAVVFFHARFPIYTLDGVLQSMFRFAVPLFFMISGYYSYYESRDVVAQKLPAKMKRIFWINFGGCFYYFVVQMAIGLFGDSHGGVEAAIERFHVLFNKRTMVSWLIFNQDPFVNIMWFTSALLYCYIIFWCINKFHLYRLFYGLIPVLLAVHLMVGNVLILFGQEVNKLYYRNFLFFGLPFFMLGNYLHGHREDILEKGNEMKCQVVFFLGLLLSIGEWFVFGRREMYLGTILVVISVFLMTMYQPEKKSNSFFTKVGKEYSLFVYIMHYSFIILLECFFDSAIQVESKAYYIYRFAKPFLVFGGSVVSAWIFYNVLHLLKNWRKK